MAELKNPVDQLVGAVLDGGWRVVEKRKRSSDGTGGHSSVSYVAELDGRKAFVKAIDIQKALEAGSVESLQEQTQLFVYEQELLRECKDLSRIVTAIGSGTIPIGVFPDAGPYPVFYLLFEMADTDARQQGNLKGRVTLAQALRSLHHVFTGMQQLHNVLIAHQDLKPSNVLHFSQEQGRQNSKIGDVGRSSKFGAQLPKSLATKKQLGDWNYAAPELMYGHMLPDWKQCRLGSDLYLVGNLIAFYFTGLSLSTMTQQQLDKSHQWLEWKGFYGDVLPYVRASMEDVLARDVVPAIWQYLGSELNKSVERRIGW